MMIDDTIINDAVTKHVISAEEIEKINTDNHQSIVDIINNNNVNGNINANFNIDIHTWTKEVIDMYGIDKETLEIESKAFIAHMKDISNIIRDISKDKANINVELWLTQRF